jgi:lysophospholipase L1-like esterase
MKRTAIVVALFSVLGACASSAVEEDSPWLVVAIGDSTPAGYGVGSQLAFPVLYGGLLADELGVQVDVANYATGSTMSVGDWVDLIETNEDLHSDLESANVVVIWMGWHDILPIVYARSAASWPDPMRKDLTDRNVELAVDWNDLFGSIRALAPDAHVLAADTALVSLLPETFGNEPFWPELKRLAFLDWRDALLEAAATHGAVVIPTWSALQGPDGETPTHPELDSEDGLHFNEAGQRFLADHFQLHDGIGAS